MLFDTSGLNVLIYARMLTVLVLALCCVHSGNGQTCTEGFAYDRIARVCVDIDECRTVPDTCRGDMQCVNQNGGYLCVPGAVQTAYLPPGWRRGARLPGHLAGVPRPQPSTPPPGPPWLPATPS
nr:fibulin-5-like [Salvelinus alpinus]